MPSPRKNPHKGIKFLDAKMMIASLSIAVTVGVWNLLANNAMLASQAAPNPTTSPPPDMPSGATDDLPALPTLIPLVTVAPMRVNQPALIGSDANTAQDLSQPVTTGLKEVTAPTQVVVQKYKPVFDQPVLGNGGGGGGGGSHSSGGSKAVTTTKSSR